MNRGSFTKFVSSLIAVGTVATVVACSSNDDGSFGGSAQDIVGGSVASAYPEAVLVNLLQNGRVTAACSGSLIAPKVVLTAGHCVVGFSGWRVTAPYAANQTANSSSAATDDYSATTETVNPNQHDIGLVFLDTPITLPSYPAIAQSPVANGSSIVNIGRIDNGKLSSTDLFVSQSIPASDAAKVGYPFDYLASDVIQPGDSGGPDEVPNTSPHLIVAVNSGGGSNTEVLARVDLIASWIADQIAAHGGGGGGAGSPAVDAGGSPPVTPPSGGNGNATDAGSAGGGARDAGTAQNDGGNPLRHHHHWLFH